MIWAHALEVGLFRTDQMIDVYAPPVSEPIQYLAAGHCHAVGVHAVRDVVRYHSPRVLSHPGQFAFLPINLSKTINAVLCQGGALFVKELEYSEPAGGFAIGCYRGLDAHVR